MPLNFRNFVNEVLTHRVITLAPCTKELLIMMVFFFFPDLDEDLQIWYVI